MQPAGAALRKRAQIAMANRTMFMWVAAVSVVVGVAVVAAIFLAQMMLFNERVLSEKQHTVTVLDANNKSVLALESNIRALDSNQALMDVKANPTDKAIQVILDALPSDANSLALGASLQNRLLTGVSGLDVQSLRVDQVASETTTTDYSYIPSTATSSLLSEPAVITFQFSAVGDEAAMKQVLKNLEVSIRTINVTSISIENQGEKKLLSVNAQAFYQPARTIGLINKVVK